MLGFMPTGCEKPSSNRWQSTHLPAACVWPEVLSNPESSAEAGTTLTAFAGAGTASTKAKPAAASTAKAHESERTTRHGASS